MEQSYRKLQQFLVMYKRNNPTATMALQVDSNGRFYCAFVSTPLASDVSKCVPQLYGMDGTFFTDSAYDGQLLTLNVRDGNGETFLMACAIVHIENADNWYWFLKLCMHSGVSFDKASLFMDRDKGSLAAIAALSHEGIMINARFCTEHLIRNAIAAFKISTADKQFPTYMQNLQRSSTLSEHEKWMQLIHAAYGEEVTDYINQINACSWMVFPNLTSYDLTDDGHRLQQMYATCNDDADRDMLHVIVGAPCKMYGCRSTNFVESDNFHMKQEQIRQSEPMEALVKTVNKFGRQAYERAQKAKEFTEQKFYITPYAQRLYGEEVDSAEQCKVHHGTFSGEDVEKIVVEELWDNGKQYIVDVTNNTCTCPKFDQEGIPCRHYIQAMKEARKGLNLGAVIDKCYLVSTYVSAFAAKSVEPTLMQYVSAVGTVLPPPAYKRPCGRPPKRHIRSSGSAPSSSTRPPGKCRLSGVTGHNARSCRNKQFINGVDEHPTPGVVVVGVEVPVTTVSKSQCLLPSCKERVYKQYLCVQHEELMLKLQPKIRYSKWPVESTFIDDSEEESTCIVATGTTNTIGNTKTNVECVKKIDVERVSLHL